MYKTRKSQGSSQNRLQQSLASDASKLVLPRIQKYDDQEGHNDEIRGPFITSATPGYQSYDSIGYNNTTEDDAQTVLNDDIINVYNSETPIDTQENFKQQQINFVMNSNLDTLNKVLKQIISKFWFYHYV